MNKFIPKHFLALLAFIHFFASPASGQMVITTNQTANQMVDRLVGAGVAYTNPTLTCATNASGKFDLATATTITMDSGIVLTSGSALNVGLAGSFSASTNNLSYVNDVDLQNAATSQIYNMCKLEFDFVPIGDTIRFNYRFGSDEYPTYTCSNFNDIFSFFISGPGYGAPTNVALIPGTSCPVSINTVNNLTLNPCGNVGSPCAPPNNALFVNSSTSTTVIYNGITTKLTAVAAVQPCSTYHMKFAIADVYDEILDSGVFLEANSFISEAATVKQVTSSNNLPNTGPFAIEGCNSAMITLVRPNPKPTSQVINLTYSGTATSGLDYTPLPISVTIPPNDTLVTFPLTPLLDALTEGTETVKIYIYGTPCGTTITDSVVIQILEYPNFTVSDNDTICQNLSTVLTATPVPLNPNLSFNWTPLGSTIPTSGTSVTASPSTNSSYTVTAIYPGCPNRDSTILITVEPTPTIALTADSVSCFGLSDAQITATGNTTFTPFSISLQPNPQSQNTSPATFSTLGSNTYTVTISSAAGCTNTSSIFIYQPTDLSWDNVNTINNPCGANNLGQIDVTTIGGTPAISYTLLPVNATNQIGQFTGLSNGAYTINAADANNCSITTILNISQPAGPVISNIDSTNITCFGANDGTIIISASSASTINYVLNPGAVSNNTGQFNALGPGTYTITLSDASTCSISTTILITQPTPINWNASTLTQVSCFGLADAQIDITASGGSGIINYTLLPSSVSNTSGSFTGLTANLYTVNAVDANNCSTSTTINITQPNVLTITNITNTIPTCVPGNDASMIITASGGTPAYNYSIGGANQLSNTFNGLGAGSFTVTVTDANTCTATSTLNIITPNAPVINTANAVDVTCFGGNNGTIAVTATGGNGAINYNLQPGNTNNASGNFSGLNANTYTITATDIVGCAVSTTLIINQPADLTWTSNISNNVLCFNGNNGDISIAAVGGNGILTYTLNPGGSSNTTGVFTGLTATTYTMTAADINNCSLSTTILITQPTPINWNASTLTQVSCFGLADAQIDITTSGGSGIINYTLLPGAVSNTSGSFTGLTANLYTVNAVDANNCSTSTTINITQPNVLTITNITNTIPTCVPGNDASMIITATGGTTAYNYSIGGANQLSNTFNGLGAGSFTVTVTDANTCTATSTLNIITPNAPIITTANAVDVTCFGGNNGTIAVTATGGNGAINYNLQPGNTNNASGNFSGLNANTYTITATDIVGCAVSTALIINQPADLTWTSNISNNVLCFNGNNGDISIAAVGGNGILTYTLNPGGSSNTTGVFTGLTATTYTMTAADINNCSLSTTILITQPTPINWNASTLTQVSCFGLADAQIDITTSGGSGIINYTLLPGAVSNTSGSFTGLTANLYTVNAVDANNCSTSTTINITQPNVLSITNITNTIPTCVPGNDASMIITATGGTTAYNYSIGGANQLSNTFNGLGAGSFTVTVTDANTCTATSTLNIITPNAPIINTANAVDVTCFGGNNGTIAVSATGGNGAINYNLQPGNTNNASGNFSGLNANTYTITATDIVGCAVSTTLIINQPADLTWTSNISNNVLCFNGNNGDISIAAVGGNGILTYTLNPGGSSNTTGVFTGLTATTYTMTAADINNCSLTTTILITQPTPISWNASTLTQVSCFGFADAQIDITASGGSGIINYTLLPGAVSNTSGSFTGLTANLYTVNAVDANNCSTSTTINITQPNVLSITNITNTIPTCVPGNDASMIITASGGTPAYNYSIGGANQLSNTFNGLGAGSFTVTVTDANTCTATSTLNIITPNAPIINTANAVDVTCFGGNNGTIAVSATGGNGTINYNLQPGNTNNASGNFSGLNANTYTITATDIVGCAVSTTLIINQPADLTWTSNISNNVLCFNSNNGDISIAAVGGNGILIYTLNPGGSSNTTGVFTGLTATTYTMTAADINNCSLTTTILITQPTPISWNASTLTQVSCFGFADAQIDITASGGSGIINYTLLPGAVSNTSGSFTGLTANLYTVNAVDANNCSTSTTINITQPNVLSITNITNTIPTCVPGNDASMIITATGGTTAYNYSIGGANQLSNTFNGLGAGSFTVTVTDANTCTATSTLNIITPNAPIINTANAVDVTCFGGNNGTIAVSATGGNGAINYNLQPGNTNNASGNFSGLNANTYTITATDIVGCAVSTTLIINQPADLTWTSNISNNVLCFNGNNGDISIAAVGGNGILTYTLNPGGSSNTTGVFTGLTATTYTMTAADINNCSLTTTILITQPTPISWNASTLTQVSCFGFADAQIDITASGGSGIINYTLLPGAVSNTSGSFTGLTANLYTVNAVDANNCSTSTTINITQPNVLSITNITNTIPTCVPGNDASMIITASGGTPAYNYSIGGANQLSNTFNGLGAGSFTVTVTDANTCTATSTLNIITPNAPIINSLLATEASCIPGCDAQITVSASGGIANYTYSLNALPFQNSNVLTNACAGNYTITVKDAIGCTVSGTGIITTANAPMITNVSTIDILCTNGNNGSLSVLSSGGTGTLNYLLTPVNLTNTNGQFNTLTAGTYSIQVTDANGCTVTSSATILEPTQLQFSNLTSNGSLCSGGNNGTLDVQTTGGTGAVTYLISPLATFTPPSLFSNLVGNTTYTITAIDANSCSISTTVFISQPTALIFNSATSNNISCFGLIDGSIQTQASGGTGLLTYTLSPGAISNTTGTFTGLNFNTYTVTVSDANNCSAQTILTINNANPIIQNSLNVVDITCHDLNNGSINISCSGGTGTLNYNLLPNNVNNTTGNFNSLAANSYTVTISDANNCSYSTTANIANPSTLSFTNFSTSDISCFGGSNGSILANALGGVGILNYQLLPININNTSGSFPNLNAMNYTVTVSDGNNCTLSSTTAITEPPILSATLINQQNLSCYQDQSGLIEILGSGGTTPYMYTLLPNNTNSNTGFFNGLSAANYSVMITDSNQCQFVYANINLTQPNPLQFSKVTKSDIACHGQNTGTLLVEAAGGTGLLNYTINPLNGIQPLPGDFQNLLAGNYIITVKDANNCSINTSVQISQNPQIVFNNIQFTEPTCYADANGTLEFTGSGGVGILKHQLNGGNPQLTGLFNNLSAGAYLCTLTDTLQCKLDTLIYLTQPDKINLGQATIYPITCKDANDGKIIAQGQGGRGEFTYYLRPGLHINKNGLFYNLHEGIYTLTIKDSADCHFDTILVIGPPQFPMTSNMTKKDIGCFGIGNEGWANVSVTGGVQPITYLWSTSPAQNNETAIDLRYGYYFVDITDANGCAIKDTVYIEPGPCCEEVFIPNAFSPNGDGMNDIFKITTSTGMELIKFEVYDRWGNKIWGTHDPARGWDGTYRGTDESMNTFYYIFWYKCLTDGQTYMRKGDVILVK